MSATEISFVVDIEPMGKERPRAVIRGRHAGVRPPLKSRAWESEFAFKARSSTPKVPLEGPLCVEILAVFPRPKKFAGRATVAYLERNGGACAGLVPHGQTPDGDNVGKLVMDAMNGRFWVDDGQVQSLTVNKYFAEKSGAPRVEVSVRTVGNE